MITPHQAGTQPYYDPLAVQFMTQGQMGHMPDSQYLTPNEYGAFRTLPNMNMMGAMPHQQMSMWQSYLIQNQGRLPFTGSSGTPYIFDVYNPAAEQSWYQTMAMRRWQDAQTSIGAGFTDTVARVGVAAALGGIPGLAVGALMPDITAPYIDRVRGMREAQGISIPKIMGGPDVAQGLGYGFSAPAARSLDASMRQMGASDMIFKQEDYKEMLKLGVDRGLFDFDISSSQYEKSIKTLRDNLEVMMKLLGSSDFKELTKSMKRLMDMGMSPEMMAMGTRMHAGYGFTTGLSVDAMMSAYGQPGAMAFSQRGLTPYQGSFQAMATAANVEISKRLGILDPGQLSRMGGVSGISQRLTDQDARDWSTPGGYGDMVTAYAYDPETGEIDTDRLDAFTSGKISVEDVFRQGAKNIKGDNYVNFLTNMDKLKQQTIDHMGAEGNEQAKFNAALSLGEYANPGGSVRDKLASGYMLLNMERRDAELLADQQSDPRYWETKKQQSNTQLRHMQESAMDEFSYYRSPLRSAWVGVRSWIEEMGDSVYGSKLDREARENQRKEDEARGIYVLAPEGSHRSFTLTADQIRNMDIEQEIIPEGLYSHEEMEEMGVRQAALSSMQLLDSMEVLESEGKDQMLEALVHTLANETGRPKDEIRAELKEKMPERFSEFSDLSSERNVKSFMRSLGLSSRQVDNLYEDRDFRKGIAAGAVVTNPEIEESIREEYTLRNIDKAQEGSDSPVVSFSPEEITALGKDEARRRGTILQQAEESLDADNYNDFIKTLLPYTELSQEELDSAIKDNVPYRVTNFDDLLDPAKIEELLRSLGVGEEALPSLVEDMKVLAGVSTSASVLSPDFKKNIQEEYTRRSENLVNTYYDRESLGIYTSDHTISQARDFLDSTYDYESMLTQGEKNNLLESLRRDEIPWVSKQFHLFNEAIDPRVQEEHSSNFLDTIAEKVDGLDAEDIDFRLQGYVGDNFKSHRDIIRGKRKVRGMLEEAGVPDDEIDALLENENFMRGFHAYAAEHSDPYKKNMSHEFMTRFPKGYEISDNIADLRNQKALALRNITKDADQRNLIESVIEENPFAADVGTVKLIEGMVMGGNLDDLDEEQIESLRNRLVPALENLGFDDPESMANSILSGKHSRRGLDRQLTSLMGDSEESEQYMGVMRGLGRDSSKKGLFGIGGHQIFDRLSGLGTTRHYSQTMALTAQAVTLEDYFKDEQTEVDITRLGDEEYRRQLELEHRGNSRIQNVISTADKFYADNTDKDIGLTDLVLGMRPENFFSNPIKDLNVNAGVKGTEQGAADMHIRNMDNIDKILSQTFNVTSDMVSINTRLDGTLNTTNRTLVAVDDTLKQINRQLTK